MINVQVLVVNGCNEVIVFSGCVQLPFFIFLLLSLYITVCVSYIKYKQCNQNPLRLYNRQLQLLLAATNKMNADYADLEGQLSIFA